MEEGRNGRWSCEPHSPQRSRMREEPSPHSQNYRRKPQQRHFRAPRFPGTAAFDLKNGLAEVPCSKRRRVEEPLLPSQPTESDTTSALSTDTLLEGNLEDYDTSVMPNLDWIEQLSKYNAGTPSPQPPVNGLRGNINTTEVDSVADSSFHCESSTGDDHSSYCPQLLFSPSMAGNSCDLPSEPSFLRTLSQDTDNSSPTTQHTLAPSAHRILAKKYAMPHNTWRESMNRFLELLHRRLPSSTHNMSIFGDLCAEMLQKLEQDVPQLFPEWDLITDNLREYFLALRTDGFDIQPSLIDRWSKHQTLGARLRKTLFPPMKGHFFGDDDQPAGFFEHYFPDKFREYLGPSLDEVDEGPDGDFGNDSPRGMAQLLMTGWLQYGRKIATSYHVYCQVAIFLAIMILAASLIS